MFPTHNKYEQNKKILVKKLKSSSVLRIFYASRIQVNPQETINIKIILYTYQLKKKLL